MFHNLFSFRRRVNLAIFMVLIGLSIYIPTSHAHGGHGNLPPDDGDIIDFYEDNTVDGVDIPIPMYHSVGDAAYSPWWITTDLFIKQMDVLAAYGYETVSFADFLAYRDGTAAPPDKPIILTFDDGYQNFYDIVRPVLKARNMTATLFLATKYIGVNEQVRQDNSWDPNAYNDKPTNHLVWYPEVTTLYQEGFSIESHSYSHPHLTQLATPAEVLAELTQPRADIRSYLGSGAASYFCYPYGDGTQDTEIHEMLEQVGYKVGVAAYPYKVADTLKHNIWQLPRLHIHEKVGVELDLNTCDPRISGQENCFYMKYIDPSFPIPDASVQVIDTAHLTGLHAAALIPGETIALTVRVMNDGDATKLQTIIKLDDDTNHSEIYYEGAQTKQVGSGQSVDYVFQVQVPDTAKIGDHSIKIDIVDEHDVLGFKHEDWQKAFTVVEPQTEWNVFLAMQVND